MKAFGWVIVPDAAGLVVEGAGEPEVDNLDAIILRDQDVLRLDIAMDDAAGVGVLERGGDFARHSAATCFR